MTADEIAAANPAVAAGRVVADSLAYEDGEWVTVVVAGKPGSTAVRHATCFGCGIPMAVLADDPNLAAGRPLRCPPCGAVA